MNQVPRVPAVMSDKEKRVASLFPGLALGVLIDGITVAIYHSLKNDGLRVSTDLDTRYRFGILMEWAIVLRGDLKWGVQRIVGAMPDILKATLAGTKWQPTNRQCWIPGDGG